MKLAKTLACVGLLAALTACGDDNGYYDSLGNWHAKGPDARSNKAGWSGETYKGNNYYTDNSARRGDSARVTDYDRAKDRDRSPYKRAGYYDYNGRYIPASASVPYVDRSYFPPRGMCRVWFVDRDEWDQPEPESCVGIRYRIPEGAYVIYGG